MKKAKTTASKKSKGRRLQQLLQQKLLERIKQKYPDLEISEHDVKVAVMGESGSDIKLSTVARKYIPFAFECKNQEKLNIWEAIKQAEENGKKEQLIPAVVIKRNNSDTYVVINLDNFLSMI